MVDTETLIYISKLIDTTALILLVSITITLIVLATIQFFK